MNVYSKAAGIAAFAWRIILTTGTGAIFAFLVARQAYGSALLPPLFIVLSFAWGLAVFLVVQSAMYAWTGTHGRRRTSMRAHAQPARAVRRRRASTSSPSSTWSTRTSRSSSGVRAVPARRRRRLSAALLGWLRARRQHRAARPAVASAPARTRRATLAAALLVIAGAFAWLYVFILGGQAYPLDIFPGYAVTSSFGDGQDPRPTCRACRRFAARHRRPWPRVPDHLAGVRALPFMPQDDARVTATRRGGRLMSRTLPRLLVSATHKSSGKTTVSLGLAAALTARGLVGAAVQEGSGLHRSDVADRGRGPRLSQPRSLPLRRGGDPRRLRRHAAGADVALVEGNKGLYDGRRPRRQQQQCGARAACSACR